MWRDALEIVRDTHTFVKGMALFKLETIVQEPKFYFQ
jgi:hypothetical protein